MQENPKTQHQHDHTKNLNPKTKTRGKKRGAQKPPIQETEQNPKERKGNGNETKILRVEEESNKSY